MLTATMLFRSVSLVCGRPQTTPFQIGEMTKESAIDLAANPDPLIIPLPSNSLLSSSRNSPYPLEDIPNLAFLNGIPGETTLQPCDPVGSIGVPTKTTELRPDDDPFDIASTTQSKPDPVVPKLDSMLTEEVRINIDSMLNGYFTYAIFGVSSHLTQLETLLTSVTTDWNSFGQDVRDSNPSFALHPTPDGGILFIFTYQNYKRGKGAADQAWVLNVDMNPFRDFVEEKSAKNVYAHIVSDDTSLQTAINSHSQAEGIFLDDAQTSP